MINNIIQQPATYLRRMLSRKKRKNPYISIRLLYKSQRARLFITKTRLDKHHADNALAWRQIFSLLRSSDRIIWGTPWHANLAYFTEARHFLADIPVLLKNIWVLGNTAEEVQAAKLAGFRSCWVNNNCWIDERIFKPSPQHKRYRAIMIAQRADYKRPWLASNTKNLVFLETRLYGNATPRKYDFQPDTEYLSGLGPSSVADIINRSSVGLMLSAVEGACKASSEYLLCGIPVVSTPSIGGRDIFYDHDNSIIVEPHIDAIEAGVAHMLERKLDPNQIHDRHLQLTREFRSRFAREVLGTIFREIGINHDPEDVLSKTYKHNMFDLVSETTALNLVLSK